MSHYQQPDARGHFGIYGGSFISETLTHAIEELKDAYAQYQHDPAFIAEFKSELAHFVGRPSPITMPLASAARWVARRFT